MKLVTPRLELVLQSPREVLNWVDSLASDVRKELSEEWLSRLKQATGPDPWSCMFQIKLLLDGTWVGSCGFKGPPNENRTVEIAYGIEEPYRGNGYAVESTLGLLSFAKGTGAVDLACAHALQENAASQAVLSKSGFKYIGKHNDPDDGEVDRWELHF